MSGDSDADSVRVICGPTATGKSSLALRLAEKFGASIISADSRQVYRRFDVGTAKPTMAERQQVRHYCVDTVEPWQRHSASDWAVEAERAIADCRARGSLPLLVGGTGFYLRALFQPLFVEPPLDPGGRTELQAHMGELTTEELRRWCAEVDPALSHLGRAQLMRAVEVATLAGARLSELQRKHARPSHLSARYLLVDSGGSLQETIRRRVHSMFDAGWEREVAELNAEVPSDAPAWKATGYRTVREMVQGQLSEEAAVQLIAVQTRQYAKRQRTWFRHQLHDADVHSVSGVAPDLMRRAAEWWTGGAAT